MPQTPEERRKLIESIADRLNDERELSRNPISDEAYRLWDQRDEAVDAMDSATNRQERDQAEAAFLAIHKDFLRALGMTPCSARDCTKFLTGRRIKYCSAECRTKDKSRKWRAGNPESSRQSLLTYLQSLPKTDLKKTVKRSRKPKHS